VLVGEARDVARRWVVREAGPGFRGAVFTGSATALPLDAPLPATSDVDVAVLVAGAVPPKPGKVLVEGVLVEASPVVEAELARVAEHPPAAGAGLAASWLWAPSFRGGQVLADPSGQLAAWEAAVAPVYATPVAIAARLDDVRAGMRTRLAALDPTARWADLVTGWLFATSLTAVLAQVAALDVPTVRKRYLRAREALPPAAYESLLSLLGCADVQAPTVLRHVDDLGDRVAEAHRVRRTPFPFAADLAPDAAPVTIGGSRDLVMTGDHREAVFWAVATAARCQQVLVADAPALGAERDREFRRLVAELTGLRSVQDVFRRRDDVLATIGAFPPRSPAEEEHRMPGSGGIGRT
jgi:hypothetical protein